VTAKQTHRKKSPVARAYHKVFSIGGLRTHKRDLLPFLDSPGGKFVEVGAGDGIANSFSLYLERCHHWHGMLVEPWPHLFARCKKRRSQALTLNVAATERSLRDSCIKVQGKPPGASIRKTLLQEAKRRMQADCDPPTPPRPSTAKEVRYVSTNSISGILERSGFDSHFELLILNLPGYESQALDGLDFERHKPTFLLIRTLSVTTSMPSMPPCYQRVAKSRHDRITCCHLFRYANFGSN